MEIIRIENKLFYLFSREFRQINFSKIDISLFIIRLYRYIQHFTSFSPFTATTSPLTGETNFTSGDFYHTSTCSRIYMITGFHNYLRITP